MLSKWEGEDGGREKSGEAEGILESVSETIPFVGEMRWRTVGSEDENVMLRIVVMVSRGRYCSLSLKQTHFGSSLMLF